MINLPPMLSHRFRVRFYFKLIAFLPGVPDPMDAEFQSISGLSQRLGVQSAIEGGRNVGSLLLPSQVTHGNVTLERGVMLRTPLTTILQQAMGSLRLFGIDMTIMALDDKGVPVATWSLIDVTPVSWSTSSLNASSSQFLINTFEFAYRDLSMMGVMT